MKKELKIGQRYEYFGEIFTIVGFDEYNDPFCSRDGKKPNFVVNDDGYCYFFKEDLLEFKCLNE